MDNRLIVKELKSILFKDLGNNVANVDLFGSQLKGTAHPDSDIDVLIVLNSDYDGLLKRRINNLCYKIDLKYDVFLDTQIISLNELNNSLRGKYPLFTNALALKHNFQSSKHMQLIGWFNKQFVKEKTIEPIYGEILRSAFKNRSEGDYAPLQGFSSSGLFWQLI